MNKKRFLVAVGMIVTLVASSGAIMASPSEKGEGYKLVTNGIEKEVLLALPSSVDECNLIPLRLALEEIGATGIKWETSTSEWQKGKITITLDNYFTSVQRRNLKRALLTENPYWNTKLPEAVITLLASEEENNEETEGCSLKQKRGIEIEIISDGYTTGSIAYNYEIRDDKLYVPSNFFKDMGIDGVTVDQANKKIILHSYSKEEIQEEVASIWSALHTSDSEELLGLWIRGQQLRSGALQYATLSDALKEKVMPEIKERGWVTGGSSPTLRGGKVTILKKEEISEQEISYTVTYESLLQGEVYETLEQTITMIKHEENAKSYWEITNVEGDVGYYTYEHISKS